jgi:hypothetical protein
MVQILAQKLYKLTGFLWFPQTLQANTSTVLQIGHFHVLLHPS